MDNIYYLIVVYNCSCEDSSTCQFFFQQKIKRVIIVDNSTINNENKAFCSENGWIYLSMGYNAGLSKAYNLGVEHLPENTEWVVFFDQDTTIGTTYINEVEQVAATGQDDIYLPLVYSNEMLISPAIIRGFLCKKIQNLNELTYENITGINSGMLIRKNVFNSCKYDERYFLDCVDMAFIRDVKTFDKKVCSMDAALKQSFSAHEVAAFSKTMVRYKIFIKDFRLFCGNSVKGRATYYYQIVRTLLRNILKSI